MNNNNINITDGLICTPEIISRYIHYYKTGIDINKPASSSTSTTSQQQQQQQLDKPQKHKPKRQKTKHISPQVLETRRTIQSCCRDNNLSLAIFTFHNALTQLIRMEPNVLYQLLNLCEGSISNKSGKVHVGTPRNVNSSKKKEEGEKKSNNTTAKDATSSTTTQQPSIDNNNISLSQRLHHASQIHSILTSLRIPLNEVVYTALIRLYVRTNNYDKAEELLDQAEGTQQCKVKLRMYSSLLRGYCGSLDGQRDEADDEGEAEDGRIRRQQRESTQESLIKALKVWKRMYDHSGGISSGHPNYKKHSSSSFSSSTNNNNNTAEVMKKEGDDDHGSNNNGNNDTKGTTTTTTTTLLFGEGISPKITLSEYEYTSLVDCATSLHDVRVMERLLSNIADEILIPGKETTVAIMNWFRNDNNFGMVAVDDGGDGSSSSYSALDYVTLPPRDDPLLGSVTNVKGWNIYRNCTVDTDTGKLNLINATSSKCKDHDNDDDEDDDKNSVAVAAKSQQYYKLQPVELTDRAWESMREMNRSIVLEGQVQGHVSLYQGGGKGKKRLRGGGSIKQGQQKQINNKKNGGNNNSNNNNTQLKNKNKSQWRVDAWKNFETFINQHPSYDIVIDGANVGYYEQNFINAPKHIDYKQIDWLVRHLLEGQQQRDHHIILFLHERHFTSNLVPQYANELLSLWESNIVPYNKLTVYRTPSGMNDDWFWMHAALLNGGSSSCNSRSSKNPNVLAITNDEMRDHQFQMLSHDSFVRWKERHQVHFDFGTWDEELRRREVILTYPRLYSRRIQRIVPFSDSTTGGDVGSGGGDAYVIPLPKKGDEKRYADGLHVAEEGVPSEETYVVIQRVV